MPHHLLYELGAGLNFALAPGMPRKKLIYTNLFPYHLCARSNNKEWFYIPKSKVWEIFKVVLNDACSRFGLEIHAFTLMDNHYHMIASTKLNHDLGFIMCYIQKSVSRKINSHSGRTNHVFGGPYKASLITSEEHYYSVLKYVFRNPLEANIVDQISSYPFCTFHTKCGIRTIVPRNGIDRLVPYSEIEQWIDTEFEGEEYSSIKKGLAKTQFKPVLERSY